MYFIGDEKCPTGMACVDDPDEVATGLGLTFAVKLLKGIMSGS